MDEDALRKFLTDNLKIESETKYPNFDNNNPTIKIKLILSCPSGEVAISETYLS